jgi:hypothetical protein
MATPLMATRRAKFFATGAACLAGTIGVWLFAASPVDSIGFLRLPGAQPALDMARPIGMSQESSGIRLTVLARMPTVYSPPFRSAWTRGPVTVRLDRQFCSCRCSGGAIPYGRIADPTRRRQTMIPIRQAAAAIWSYALTRSSSLTLEHQQNWARSSCRCTFVSGTWHFVFIGMGHVSQPRFTSCSEYALAQAESR